MSAPHPEITIVGASLAGLTLALACVARGVPVHVVERSAGHVHGGDSLSIDLALVAAATGHDPRQPPVLPVVPAYRELTTWPALYAWLRERAIATPGIVLEEGKTVASITDLGDRARITFADGSERVAAAVIGADGYRSTVRRAIAPEAPFARYAGYLVWRGLVEERTLARPVPWPSDGGLWIEFMGGYRLVAATLPGRDGSVEPGRRQVTFAWFDVHRDELLRRSGCLTADGEKGSPPSFATARPSSADWLNWRRKKRRQCKGTGTTRSASAISSAPARIIQFAIQGARSVRSWYFSPCTIWRATPE